MRARCASRGRLLGCRERDGRRTLASEREIDEVRGSVGMVFQHVILWPYMMALGNVTEALRMVKRMSRRDAEESGLDVLRRVGLETHAGHNPEQLYDGRIVEQGPPAQLFAAPQSERLRAFLNIWRERSI